MIIDVTCAIIERKGLTLAVQRSTNMTLPLKWEFPGGKIEANENAEECLIREIMEELNIQIHILKALPLSDYNYIETKTIRLHPFICQTSDKELHLTEHSDFGWFSKQDLLTLNWAEADLAVLRYYIDNTSLTS